MQIKRLLDYQDTPRESPSDKRSAKLAELYEIEKEMRSMGMVEGSWVSRKPPNR
jgi:hypothetical protein